MPDVSVHPSHPCPRPTWRRAGRAGTVLASALVMVAAGVLPASAQSVDPGSAGSGQSVDPGSAGSGQSVDPASVAPSVAPGSLLGIPSLSVAGSTQIGAAIPLTSVLGSVGAIGSSNFPRPGSSMPPAGPIATRDPAIDSSELVRVEPLFPGSPYEHDRRAEVWYVTSESMQREIRVEVYRAPDGWDAPNVYWLDGVDSYVPSGWSTGMGWGDPELRNRHVNVIVPTGGPASMWSDWETDDDVLGPNKWETFLTEELPPVLEQGRGGTAPPLAHNGDWGVFGISMGAASALHLANSRPDMFSATGGVSGAYSTTDELGYQYARLTVGARHGDVTNMWGPRGSQAWQEHDTIADPSGLSDMNVYLSAATGVVGSSELGHFGSDEMTIIDGHILEKGSYESTRKLESALQSVPGVELHTQYMPTGIHNWPVFVPQMRPGMDHILAGLAPAVPNPSARSGALAAETLGGGSSGSAGSGSAGSGLSSGSSGS